MRLIVHGPIIAAIQKKTDFESYMRSYYWLSRADSGILREVQKELRAWGRVRAIAVKT